MFDYQDPETFKASGSSVFLSVPLYKPRVGVEGLCCPYSISLLSGSLLPYFMWRNIHNCLSAWFDFIT